MFEGQWGPAGGMEDSGGHTRDSQDALGTLGTHRDTVGREPGCTRGWWGHTGDSRDGPGTGGMSWGHMGCSGDNSPGTARMHRGGAPGPAGMHRGLTGKGRWGVVTGRVAPCPPRHVPLHGGNGGHPPLRTAGLPVPPPAPSCGPTSLGTPTPSPPARPPAADTAGLTGDYGGEAAEAARGGMAVAGTGTGAGAGPAAAAAVMSWLHRAGSALRPRRRQSAPGGGGIPERRVSRCCRRIPSPGQGSGSGSPLTPHPGVSPPTAIPGTAPQGPGGPPPSQPPTGIQHRAG